MHTNYPSARSLKWGYKEGMQDRLEMISEKSNEHHMASSF